MVEDDKSAARFEEVVVEDDEDDAAARFEEVVGEDDEAAMRFATGAVRPVPVPVVVLGSRGCTGRYIAVPVVVPGGRGCKGRPVIFVCSSILLCWD